MDLVMDTDEVKLYRGDCRVVMAALPDSSVDSIVTDPPYELGFMGRGWDSSGIAFDPEVWAQALRVLKPGGHLLAFGGTRTWHRVAVAIEDAGFEIRDSIAWLYGSGFPKSMDVSKAIDKAAGAERTEGSREWEGWGTALKPAHEPVVVARKPLAGTVAANVLAYGTGALNIAACRVGSATGLQRPERRGKGNAGGWADYAQEPGQYGTPDGAGRWPSNVLLDESQAAELDKQSGELPTQATRNNPARESEGGIFGLTAKGERSNPGAGETGGASRFFYVAKAGRSERPKVGDTQHATVKPLTLMRYLVKLVTPPGGTVLEPFAGSGTTLEAAILEGFSCIGIELDEDGTHIPLIMQRLGKPLTPAMF